MLKSSYFENYRQNLSDFDLLSSYFLVQNQDSQSRGYRLQSRDSVPKKLLDISEFTEASPGKCDVQLM